MNMLPAIEESDCHNPNCSTQIALTTLILDERNLIPSGLLSQPRYLARPPPPLRRYLCHHHDGFSTTFPRLPTNPLFRASWIDSISRVLPPLGLSQYLSSVANPLPQARPSVDPLSGSWTFRQPCDQGLEFYSKLIIIIQFFYSLFFNVFSRRTATIILVVSIRTEGGRIDFPGLFSYHPHRTNRSPPLLLHFF